MRRFSPVVLAVLAIACGLSAAAPAQPLTPQRESALRPKDSFRECEVCPEMVVVPPGAFTMGSPANERYRDRAEGPQHVVTLKRAFAVGKYEVTVDDFAAFADETKHRGGSECWTIEKGIEGVRKSRSWRNPAYPQTGTHPVSCMSWDDAKAYVAWLANKTGRPYRLLSEAEWEYAARARTEPGPAPRYLFGDDDKEVCQHGNVADQSARKARSLAATRYFLPCDDGYPVASPVGSFLSNGFGLYDMLGNVWEWVEDCWNTSYRGAPVDGTAWLRGDCRNRVLRGGAWDDYQKYLRAAMRYYADGTDDRGIMGLRVARSLAGP
jgi:formylglycine-generating enzyme required for sulfatase activity